MNTEDGMTINERRKYLRLIQKRYRKASRKDKAQLLDEMGTVTGMHRKTLVRLMNSDLERKQRRKQRGRSYGVQVHYALKVISEAEQNHPHGNYRELATGTSKRPRV